MSEKSIKKILIANRGEIAVRIIRTCKEMGIKTVAAYSEADKNSMAVNLADESICIGSSSAKDSYLNIANLISACDVMGADAIHPGVGFLSENSKFASICKECDIKFIGPSPESIAMMGDKSIAKSKMKEAGIPVVEGSQGEINDLEEALKVAHEIGYPVIIKAALGGGGKGIRIAYDDEMLKKAYNISKMESKACFNSEKIYIEKFIEKPKHIEFQIISDEYGNVVHLGERNCSIQRRNQKVIEEAPFTDLSDELREKMGQAAIKAAKAVKYTSVGTVEFLLDENNKFYFMEMNARIQVEHPITESVTGIDIVKEQINIAQGKKISFTQDDIKINGHSIECRINAEDPKKDFSPCSGEITKLILPGGIGIRTDSSVSNGSYISLYYDSLIAKIIAHGRNRTECIQRMKRALHEFSIEGVETNLEFQKWIINHKDFIDGEYNSEFLKKVGE